MSTHILDLLAFVPFLALFWGVLLCKANFSLMEYDLVVRWQNVLSEPTFHLALTLVFLFPAILSEGNTALGFIALIFSSRCWKSHPDVIPRIPDVFRDINFLIVTKGSNTSAVQCTIESALASVKESEGFLTELGFNANIVMLLDEGTGNEVVSSHGPGIKICIVPNDYDCPRGGRYKARALHYFVNNAELHNDDWIFHLDEETALTTDTVRAVASFASQSCCTQYFIGQCLIFYNHRKFWKNSLITVADIARVVDDLGKLFWQNTVTHLPWWGVRGSSLLIKASAEKSIGWDTTNLVEDYWFAQQACEKQYKCGWVRGICREESPQSFRDFFRQRRRWYAGLWYMGGNTGRCQMILSMFGTCSPEAVLILANLFPKLSVPSFTFGSAVLFAAGLSMRLATAVIQDLDAEVTLISLLKHQTAVILLNYPSKLMEYGAAVSAIISPPTTFEVVSKG
ncbi:glycosyl transferase family group 2-domain-containing protein [Clohesyomyces aquaticus]|uniref:Glycosyl transferase family group 2-domain-containing protein n=1 Tax=Clohesyomyces aquaticus TaxID=1231657 RepID=A0A1Y1ZHU0_9PLEO|nr:glycosyl transferase family group 2-domain-containing protein [Clohesyomyces aquaticus]